MMENFICQWPMVMELIQILKAQPTKECGNLISRMVMELKDGKMVPNMRVPTMKVLSMERENIGGQLIVLTI